MVFPCQFRFFRRHEQDRDGEEHDGGNDDEQRLVVDVVKPLYFGIWIHDGGDNQVKDAAHRAHQVDDGVALGAQGLRGHVRHQGHGRGTVRSHGNQKQPQHDDEGCRLKRGRRRGVAVVQKGQDVDKDDGAAGSEQDKRHALPDARVRPVGNGAEQWQQEQCQNVVRGHDRAGERLVQVERVGQNQGDDAVIHLPESRDGQERQSDQDGTFVV